MINVCLSFPELKVASSDSFFYLTVSLKPKEIQFTIIYDKQAETFEKLEFRECLAF